MARTVFEPGFEPLRPGEAGRRFCIWQAPAASSPLRGVIVQVPAFAEEMNRSRRMVAMQARALAAAGWAVLQFDLLGCGDSRGDFGDATWDEWLQDVQGAVALAQWRATPQGGSSGALPLWLWGHRAGCLLACEAAVRLQQPHHLLLWQPTLSGKTVLQQFLRLETAARLMENAPHGPSAKDKLAADERAEVSGYEIQPALARGLEEALLLPAADCLSAIWLDVAPDPRGSLPPAAEAAVARWSSAVGALTHQTVQGPAFWQTTEIEDAPQLLGATQAALLQHTETAGVSA